MRLVPDMTPAKAFSQYKSYVEKIAPAGVDLEVRLIHSGDPCLIQTDNRYIQAATRALHEVWGKDTVFIRSGGSIPIVGDFARHLGLPSVMMGFGLPDDNLHAPNEKFNLKNFELGIRKQENATPCQLISVAQQHPFRPRAMGMRHGLEQHRIDAKGIGRRTKPCGGPLDA